MSADPACLFCKIIAGEIPSRKVYEDEYAFAFLDIAPWHRGHTLVIPKNHVVDVRVAAGSLVAIAPAIEHVAQLLTARLGAEGLNVTSSAGAVAGQEVFHLHVHVVPRYRDQAGLRQLFVRQADDSAAALDQVLAELS